MANNSVKKWARLHLLEEDSSLNGPPLKKTRSASLKQCSRKESSNKSIPISCPQVFASSDDWISGFEPKTVTDLAIHQKKIEEVQNWFRRCDELRKSYPAQMLLLTGSSGCGKTAVIKVLAREFQYELVEWTNPVEIELVSEDRSQNDPISFKDSQGEVFKNFLFPASRYKSLFAEFENRIVLIKDFPNIFIRNPEGFNEILENYKQSGKSPLIFIATETECKSLNIVKNLFPEHIRHQYDIFHIGFNPISTTLIKKSLKRTCAIMATDKLVQMYKIPSQDIIDSINAACHGDIRNALINLHFASLKGAPQLEMESTQSCSTSSQKTRNIAKKLKSIGRSESITMLHALGRVFNPKYIENSGPKKFFHSPEIIAESFSSEPNNFSNLIHSNYLSHFDNIENVLPAIDGLCHCNSIINEYRDSNTPSIGLNIAVRSVMVGNENPVGGWMPIRGIKKPNISYTLASELRKAGLCSNITHFLYASEYKTYADVITSKRL